MGERDIIDMGDDGRRGRNARRDAGVSLYAAVVPGRDPTNNPLSRNLTPPVSKSFANPFPSAQLTRPCPRDPASRPPSHSAGWLPRPLSRNYTHHPPFSWRLRSLLSSTHLLHHAIPQHLRRSPPIRVRYRTLADPQHHPRTLYSPPLLSSLARVLPRIGAHRLAFSTGIRPNHRRQHRCCPCSLFSALFTAQMGPSQSLRGTSVVFCSHQVVPQGRCSPGS